MQFRLLKESFSKINVKVLILIIFALLASTISQPVVSAPLLQTRQFEQGDILVSVNSGQVLWYDHNGKFIQSLQSKFNNQFGGLAINPVDNTLYLADIGGVNLSIFNRFGQYFSNLAPGFDKGSFSIVFDVHGNMYVSDITTYGHILRIDHFDKHITEYKVGIDRVLSSAILSLDLSVDQRTLYYTGGRVIRRFDVVSGEPLNDFAVLPISDPGFAANLRLLYPGDGSGGLLVADQGAIKRLDQFGSVLQVYDTPQENRWISLSLDPDGTSFWGSSGTRVYKFDITSGKQLLEFDAGADIPVFSQTNSIGGLTVIGAPFAAQPTVTPTFTPSPTATATSTLMPTSTSTLTSTPVFPFITQTFPVPTEASVKPNPAPFFPFILVLVVLFVIALVVSGMIMLGSTISRPQRELQKSVSQPLPRVSVRPHADLGRQTIEPSSNPSLLRLRLKAGQGETRYTVQSGDSQGGE